MGNLRLNSWEWRGTIISTGLVAAIGALFDENSGTTTFFGYLAIAVIATVLIVGVRATYFGNAARRSVGFKSE